MANINARKAYVKHTKGNQLSEQGKVQEAARAHAEALELYEKAYADGMNDASYLLAYSVLLMRAGNFEKSHEVMLKADKIKMPAESKRQLRINYSVLQWKMGNLDKAIEVMQGVARGAKTSIVYTTLGEYLIEKAIQTGDFSEAIAFNDEAYEYDEDDAGTLDNIAQLKLAMGEREAAIDYFKRAIDKKPTQVVSLYNLAKIYFEDGKRDEARELINRAAEGNYSALSPVSREQTEALKAQIG